MSGKKLTEDQRDAALAMLRAGKTYTEIKSALSISIGSVHNIAKTAGDKDLSEIVREIKRGYTARNLLLAEHLMERIPMYINERTNVKDMAIAAAILTDKALNMEKSDRAEQAEKMLERKMDQRLDKLLGPVPGMLKENEINENEFDGISFMDSGRYEDFGPVK